MGAELALWSLLGWYQNDETMNNFSVESAWEPRGHILTSTLCRVRTDPTRVPWVGSVVTPSPRAGPAQRPGRFHRWG
jgi:hypothetical protein